ncbi:filament-like plant protein 7 [Argentina anserina]|uniref:filament-like plant protein 7 n=1 Tax=Argentina anserina TaxID=57926 RepID=UPI0021764EDF|nr:filament-like plant protein 7 [Potentilla anserina]XP_050366961.1 filament-like plant protein 7 [Potentilla anserina]XP_050366962.1 filament-like plant protein 7 [Potentilla anserina]XP_050366963.1 filament-like plant protein 7 [Potentilla anserina]XP_050366964.1 filament-like plant protein 7 [Potentilla anserina]
MDHKGWLWRKKSSEKTVVSTNRLAIALGTIEEEVQYPVEDGHDVERPGKNLNEKLASVLLDSSNHEECIPAHLVPKQELDEALRQGIAANERSIHSDDALKECVEQLIYVREEQEQRIHDAVMMTSREYEKSLKNLEAKLYEKNEQVTNLAVENTNLTRSLQAKERFIEDLRRQKSQTDAEFSALMARLDSTEKENAFLRYEFHMLEKELEIRSEEMEYNRRSAEESHKQHLESMMTITELEQECQRLHLLLRKRLPGPVSMNMKNELKMVGRDQTDMRRRKLNPTRDMIVRDANMRNSPEIPNKSTNFMTEQLRKMEEENKVLRDILTRKNSELLSSRNMHSEIVSRLSQAEKSMELSRFSPILADVSRSSRYDICSDDGMSSSESWAGALLSELEHFRSGRLRSPQDHKETEVSDMSLMDDFVEMEKLAIVSVETPPKNTHNLRLASKDLVRIGDHSTMKMYGESTDAVLENSFDWLQVVLKAMLEQKNVSKQSLDELFEDIKIALGYLNQPTKHEASKTAEPQEKSVCLALVASSNDNKLSDELQEENSRLKDELKKMESAKKEMEAKLQSATEENEALMVQLQESQQSLGTLQAEMDSLREEEGMIEDQLENQKSINEDLDTQLTIAKAKLNEVFQKFSSLEVELEDKHNCFEELEATCLELQLQQESAAKTEAPEYGTSKEEKQSQPGWEITTASVKLAECQETILNLGKQLKALATPREAALFDKVFSTTSAATNATNNNFSKRSSLRDRLLADEDPRQEVLKSPKDKQAMTDADAQKSSHFHSDSHNALSTPSALVNTRQGQYGSKHLAIVPSKKQGGFGFLKRLLLRRKKGSSKKPHTWSKA